MARLDEMLKKGEYQNIWNKYCGFIDLNLDEFMQIQERLLMEQIELLSNCELGKKIMGNGVKPKSVEEFRQMVPLTTYHDYADILLNKKEDALPSKPKYWIKTTWRGGFNEYKLAPYSEGMINEHAKAFMASLILATSKKRGEFSLRENDKFLYGMAPLPYLTGLAPRGIANEINFEYLPGIEKAESMGFEERNKVGFNLAKNKGIDLFFGLSSVLIKIGEEFAKGSNKEKTKVKPKNPKMMGKLIKAYYKKNIRKETILPKDIWDIKGLLCAGTDSHSFKEKIKYYWGTEPLEIYGGTELATVATETWGDGGLTFFPDVNFLEFITEKDSMRSINDPSFVPKTLLINEIMPGERYELVITKFRGGAFVRYRVGDMIECVSLENKENKISLPQIRFADRISNVIDLAGFTRITKETIENAIEKSNVQIDEWVACKEFEEENPVLRIYAEIKHKEIDEEGIKEKLHENLKRLDSDYNDLESMLNRDCFRMTFVEDDRISKMIAEDKSFVKMNPHKANINRIREI